MNLLTIVKRNEENRAIRKIKKWMEKNPFSLNLETMSFADDRPMMSMEFTRNTDNYDFVSDLEFIIKRRTPIRLQMIKSTITAVLNSVELQQENQSEYATVYIGGAASTRNFFPRETVRLVFDIHNGEEEKINSPLKIVEIDVRKAYNKVESSWGNLSGVSCSQIYLDEMSAYDPIQTPATANGHISGIATAAYISNLSNTLPSHSHTIAATTAGSGYRTFDATSAITTSAMATLHGPLMTDFIREAPTPITGTLRWDEDRRMLTMYNGSNWIDIDGGLASLARDMINN